MARARRSGRRNLAILAGLFAILAVGLLFAARSGPPTIMPPESEEIRAKRSSPDNGWFAVRDALDGFPEKPAILRYAPEEVEVRNGVVVPRPSAGPVANPGPGSIGAMLGSPRSDDNPELLAYLNDCEPPARELRRALGAMDYFLYPDHKRWGPDTLQPRLKRVMPVLAALAVRELGVERAPDTALAYLDTMWRLGSVLLTDGGNEALNMAHSFYERGLRLLVKALRLLGEPAEVRRVRDRFSRYTAWPREAREYLAFEFRVLDLRMAEGVGGGNMPERLLMGLAARKRIRQIRANRDRLFRAAGESRHALRHDPRYADMRESGMLGHVMSPPLDVLVHLAMYRDVLIDAWHAADIIFALEEYAARHGQYPPNLEALVPDCLDEVPVYRGPNRFGEYFVYVERDGRRELLHAYSPSPYWRAPADVPEETHAAP